MSAIFINDKFKPDIDKQTEIQFEDKVEFNLSINKIKRNFPIFKLLS